MRTLITGDLHFSHNPRDAYRFGFMKWFRKLARDRKPDRIIIAGDLTEEKDRHPSKLVNEVVDHVHALAQIAPVIALEGNHDYKDEGHAFFKFLRRIENTRWIAKPTALDDGVLLLPHTNDYKNCWGDIDMAQYPTIVCHQTFNGANVGFGRGLDGIPLDVLPRKSTTFCGDVHVPQEMEQLVYIGAPYHVDFGDDYEARVIECNGREWVSVDTSTLPQKRAFNITRPADLNRQVWNKGDLIQITVEVDDMSDWPTLRDNIQGMCGERGLRVWAIKPKVMKKAVRRQHKVADARSDLDVLKAFGRRHGLSTAIMKRGEKLL
jgi:DNA repair exonuclease SbcCD nuclease subunit